MHVSRDSPKTRHEGTGAVRNTPSGWSATASWEWGAFILHFITVVCLYVRHVYVGHGKLPSVDSLVHSLYVGSRAVRLSKGYELLLAAEIKKHRDQTRQEERFILAYGGGYVYHDREAGPHWAGNRDHISTPNPERVN